MGLDFDYGEWRNPYFPMIIFCHDLEKFHLVHDEMHGMNGMDDKCLGNIITLC